tara:strand:+ start:273 stop:1157 length:885 start_codon:yes stop_codon:yes gene_type:complete
MSNFSKKLNKTAKDVNNYLKFLFSQQRQKSFLIKPMKYSLFSGGKRFRTAIIVNTGKIFNVSYKKLIIIGAAVECMHAYSLIHDDLPAMDNDNFRRGKLSTHKKFNEFTAILAGNSLLTLAFEILSSKKLDIKEKNKNELITLFSNCSGHSGLAGGQYFDLTYENKRVSTKNILDMQNKKTGKLFSFCCESIAIIKGNNLKNRKILKDIGSDIGLLFQITDDLIDHKGNSKIVGKPTKRDAKKGKATLVNLIGYEKTLLYAKKLKRKVYSKVNKLGLKNKDLLQSIDFILNRNF